MNEWEKELIERLHKVFASDTQKQTADKINTTQGNVSKILNGKQSLTLENIYLISKAYGVSVDWLLGANRPKLNNSDENFSYSNMTKALIELINKGAKITEEKSYKFSITIDDPILHFLLKKGMTLCQTDEESFTNWNDNKLSLFDDKEVLYSSIFDYENNLWVLAQEARSESDFLKVYEEAAESQKRIDEIMYEPGPFGESE